MPRYYTLNPFALADFVNGSRTRWSEVQPNKRLEIVREAIGLDHWSELYPPGQYESLLTAFSNLPHGFRFPDVGAAMKVLTGPLEKVKAQRPFKLERVIPHIVPLDKRPAERLPDPPLLDDPGGFGETVSFLDPEQGFGNTCSAVATLIAAAWTKKEDVTQQANESMRGIANGLSWPFSTSNGKERIQISPSLLSGQDQKPLVCRSTEPNEFWPSYLEKAIVSYVKRPATGELVITDYGTFSAKDSPVLKPGDKRELPQIVLDAFFGGTSLKFLVLGRMSNVLAAVQQRLGIDGKTVIVPMLAETMSSRELAGRAPELVNELKLFPSHVYAVLGLIERGGVRHLVLRDPYGVDKDQRETIAVLAGAVPQDGNANQLNEVLGIKVIPLRTVREAFFALYAAGPAQA